MADKIKVIIQEAENGFILQWQRGKDGAVSIFRPDELGSLAKAVQTLLAPIVIVKAGEIQ